MDREIPKEVRERPGSGQRGAAGAGTGAGDIPEVDEIAQRRYNTSVESFMIGKINTLDLNDAQLSKDNARAAYVSEMHLYWYYLYQLRSLTLHDFVNDANLDAEFEQLIN